MAEGESIEDLLPDLRRLVLIIKEARMTAGLTFEESMVVAHATDSWRKHRKKLANFYKEVYAEGRMQAHAETPKADDAVAEAGDELHGTLITGDPLHDIINFRKKIAAYACDSTDLIYDHMDVMNRLSAKAVQSDLSQWPQPPPLAGYAHSLLRTGVEQPVAVFKAALQKHEAAAHTLRAWLELPLAHKSATWKDLFHATPPRGTLARLARRCGATLHESTSFRNYATVKAFRTEIRRVRAWYQHGRRVTRPFRGIKRNRTQQLHVRGIRKVWTAKVAKHYKILLKSRVPALWAWREIALEIHKVGVPVQSGTQPTERLWSCLLQMFPQAGRTVTLPWFTMLAKLAFIRYNHGHFCRGHLPTWCERDPLLLQRADALTALLFEEDPDLNHLISLFAPFSRANQ